jgi:integrase
VKSAAKSAGIQEVVAEREPTEAEIERKGASDSIKFCRVTVHTLRHTFSHLLEEAGLPTEARQAALDHENIDTTKEHYSYDQSDYEKLIREMRYEEKTDVDDGE